MMTDPHFPAGIAAVGTVSAVERHGELAGGALEKMRRGRIAACGGCARSAVRERHHAVGQADFQEPGAGAVARGDAIVGRTDPRIALLRSRPEKVPDLACDHDGDIQSLLPTSLIALRTQCFLWMPIPMEFMGVVVFSPPFSHTLPAQRISPCPPAKPAFTLSVPCSAS